MNRLNRGYVYRERLGNVPTGTSVLDYLTRTYGHSPREVWLRRIESGEVHQDGERAEAATPVRPGSWLTWARPAWEEPEVPAGLRVLREDAQCLAVDKPAGLPTLPGGGFLENTLLARVRSRYPEAVPAHRLGRWTSGVVLFARTPFARSHFGREWSAGRVYKRYRALASGTPSRTHWTVDVRIGPVPHFTLGTLEAVNPDGRAARSEVTVLEERETGFLADVVIQTGRPHQVRIHLAACGHPLVGDPLYPAGGTPSPGTTALPGDPGYRLHAAELRLMHPTEGTEIAVVSPPPLDLRTRAERDAVDPDGRPRERRDGPEAID